jgi:hypothetical protein
VIRSIPRRETIRGTQWHPTSLKCLELASRNPSWQRSCATATTDRTYDRKRSGRTPAPVRCKWRCSGAWLTSIPEALIAWIVVFERDESVKGKPPSGGQAALDALVAFKKGTSKQSSPSSGLRERLASPGQAGRGNGVPAAPAVASRGPSTYGSRIGSCGYLTRGSRPGRHEKFVAQYKRNML